MKIKIYSVQTICEICLLSWLYAEFLHCLRILSSLAYVGAAGAAAAVSYQNHIRFPLGMRNYNPQKIKKVANNIIPEKGGMDSVRGASSGYPKIKYDGLKTNLMYYFTTFEWDFKYIHYKRRQKIMKQINFKLLCRAFTWQFISSNRFQTYSHKQFEINLRPFACIHMLVKLIYTI